MKTRTLRQIISQAPSWAPLTKVRKELRRRRKMERENRKRGGS